MLFHRSEHTKVSLEPFGVVILNSMLHSASGIVLNII